MALNFALGAAWNDFFPYRLTIEAPAGGTFRQLAGHIGLSANYDADTGTGRGPAGMMADAPASDTIILQGAYPAIAPNMRALLTFPDEVTKRRFKITAAAPDPSGSATILTVTPDK